jgi:Cu/Ag efflux protein CusF
LAIPFALAACEGSNDNTAQTENTPTAAASMPMNNGAMPMAQASGMGQMANAEGRVTAVDNQAGTITIKHGPVIAVNWPAMTMAFKADSAMRQQVAVGDKVAFSFELSNGSGRLTAIRKK